MTDFLKKMAKLSQQRPELRELRDSDHNSEFGDSDHNSSAGSHPQKSYGHCPQIPSYGHCPLIPSTPIQFDKPVFPLMLNGFDVIAEIKERSPSEGALNRFSRSRQDQAASYAAGGAIAISVLTEPSYFGGDMAHLSEVVAVAEATETPVMRKDFLVDPLQILEARAAGASGVLLIVAMLSNAQLSSMLDCAREHSMFVLMESFDESDLRRTADLMETERHLREAQQGRLIAGINSRDLRTLHVDPERLQKLSSMLPTMLPTEMICVAESGIHDANDAARAASLGYRIALVGTAFMRSDDPALLLSGMLRAGRGA